MELQDLSQPTKLSNVNQHRDLGFSTMTYRGEFEERFQMRATYYRLNKCKLVLYIILSILTMGFVMFLLKRWFLRLRLALLYSQCSFEEVTHVLVTKTANNIKLADDQLVELEVGIQPFPSCPASRVFIYEFIKFYISCDTYELFALKNSYADLTCSQVTELQPLTQPTTMYGLNIMDIPIKPVPLLLFDEILTPFNLFQFAALALWAYDNYLMYSLLILFLTLIQIGFALKELRDNLIKIRLMILFETQVQVMRPNVVKLSSSELVPGDIFEIHGFTKIPCDCILIQGQCTMNEAILTGESIPINKTALLKTTQLFTTQGNENSMLYSGTTCLRSEASTLAIAYQTGFQTLKGSLARSIMFSKAETFSFQRDSLRYLAVLAFIGLIQAAMTFYIGYVDQMPFKESLINALELITIIVPPTLPTALGAGISLAINRLEKGFIQCVKPDKVNVAAKVNICAFDKTGTLTELGLDVLGCRPVKQNGFDKQQPLNNANNEHFGYCLASCHSLSIIEDQLQGDPIDLTMFKETGWSYEEDCIRNQDNVMRTIRRFDFVAELQRMSVITDRQYIYTKGSPEVMRTICLEVPPNYVTMLQRYTAKGYRVIACAYKQIPEQLITQIPLGRRELFECQLNFLGFLIFENKLKPETSGVIRELKEANLKTLMVTGDNPYTAINIGLECNILDSTCRLFMGQIINDELLWDEIEQKSNDINEDRSVYSLDNLGQGYISSADIMKLTCQLQLVVTGGAFEYLNQQYYHGDSVMISKLLVNIYVYARMKPNNKGDLMTLLKQNKQNFLAFCGDGTNDTCALRQADVGLALSTDDASLAAPFTSTVFNISSMITLIREGRASLVTCVECFKFMTLYSCIQSAAVLQCYLKYTDWSSYQYLYQDLWLIIPLAITMDLTKAYPKLANYRPISDLISYPVLASVIIEVLICVSSQVTLLQIMMEQSFYEPTDDYDEDTVNQVNSLLVIVGNTQILAVAIAYTQGPPFREKIHQNLYYMGAVIIGTAGHVFIMLFPTLDFFSSIESSFPWYFRWELIGYNLAIAVAIIVYEKLIVYYLSRRYSLSEMNQQ